MYVLNADVITSIADLKKHTKRILKTLEISHYAYILCSNDHGKGIGKLNLSSAQTLEIISAAFNFKSYAALTKTLNPAESSATQPKIGIINNIKYRIASILLNDIPADKIDSYSEFLAKHAFDYLKLSGILTNPSTPTNIESHYDFSLIQYLAVSPLCSAMKEIVENTVHHQINNANQELSIQHHIPLPIWVEVSINNNLIEEFVDLIGSKKNKTIHLPTSLIIQGSPRFYQLPTLVKMIEANHLGEPYFKVGNMVYNTATDPVFLDDAEIDSNAVVSNYKIPIKMEERLEALILKSTAQPNTHITPIHLLKFDPYGIKDKIKIAQQQAIDAKIFEGTQYFLETCQNHLQDLNSALDMDSTAALLACRKPNISEISWRRHVCHYAENIKKSVTHFFNINNSKSDPQKINRTYFNEYGILMLDFDNRISTTIGNGKWISLSAYDFSLFANLLSNIIFVRSMAQQKNNNPHLLAMSYMCFRLLHQLKEHPKFKELAKQLDPKIYSEFYALQLNKLDQIDKKGEYIIASTIEKHKGKVQKYTTYSLCPKGLSGEVMTIHALRKLYPNITGDELIEKINSYSVTPRDIHKNNSNNISVQVLAVNQESMNGMLESKGKSADIKNIGTGTNDLIIDFDELFLWLSHRMRDLKKPSDKPLKGMRAGFYALCYLAMNKTSDNKLTDDEIKKLSLLGSTIEI